MEHLNIFTESLLIIILVSLVFLSGAYLGQLKYRIYLAKLEKENLLLGQKRMTDLKKLLRGHHASPAEKPKYDNLAEEELRIKNEIDDILDEIGGS